MLNSKTCEYATDRTIDGVSNRKNPTQNTDSSSIKLRSGSTTANLPLKRINAPTVVKPSIALITWRSTCEVARRLLHTLPNDNYVKQRSMDPPHSRMDPQHLRNRWWKRCKRVVRLPNRLNIGRHLK